MIGVQGTTANEDSLYVHGYMSNSGYEEVRQTLAERLNKLYGKSYTAENLLMTVGAAGGLNVIFKALLAPNSSNLRRIRTHFTRIPKILSGRLRNVRRF